MMYRSTSPSLPGQVHGQRVRVVAPIGLVELHAMELDAIIQRLFNGGGPARGHAISVLMPVP